MLTLFLPRNFSCSQHFGQHSRYSHRLLHSHTAWLMMIKAPRGTGKLFGAVGLQPSHGPSTQPGDLSVGLLEASPKRVGGSFSAAPLARWPRGRGLPGSLHCPHHPSRWPQPLMEGIRERIWLGTAPGCSPRGRGEANVKLCPRKDTKDLACGSTTSLGDGQRD